MESLAKDTNIYVLLLKGGNYYIGRSDTPSERILSHFKNCGSEWTKLHKPRKVVESFVGDRFDEDKLTKKYMHQYGIDKVRGASYCQVILLSSQIKSITRELSNVEDRCFKCSAKGHFAIDCDNALVSSLEKMKLTDKCKRCGRNTHTEVGCFANNHLDGSPLDRDFNCDSDSVDDDKGDEDSRDWSRK